MKFLFKKTSWHENPPISYEGMANETINGYRIFRIEINTFEELMKLYEKEGAFIIGSSCYKKYPLMIEIYDDYRE